MPPFQLKLFRSNQKINLQVNDWVMHTDWTEQFFVVNRITDDAKKVAVLLTVIGETVYALVRNLLAPAKPAEKSFDVLVKVMKDHLKPKPLVIAEVQVSLPQPARFQRVPRRRLARQTCTWIAKRGHSEESAG